MNPHRHFAVTVLILVFFICGVPLGSAEATPAEHILRLTPDKDHYLLGPNLYYLEDPEKKLTIEEVSSPRISGRFIKHKRKKINLGLNPYAYCIRFTIIASDIKDSDQKWLLYFGWPRPGIIDKKRTSPVNE